MEKDKTHDFPYLPKRLNGLAELANNLWWSWHPAARMVFKMIDRRAWKDSGHNPYKMLCEIPRNKLDDVASDPEYLRHYDVLLARFRSYMAEKECPLLHYQNKETQKKIAYFSAEYGLHHSLPFYAGGLGFLAGDHLKECSDLKVPLVAVGFMYPEGYVQQHIREDGWQEKLDQPLNRIFASISKVLDKEGNQLVVKVPQTEPSIYVTVWKIDVGRVSLYLMDTDIDQNDPWNRGISARLYSGDLEMRLRQEIVLGIGGSEVLEALGIKYSVLHLNEGHAVLALLERFRDCLQCGMSFEQTRQYVRETTIFTTHTPVPAGHDIFPFQMIEKYFHSFWPALEMDRDSFLALGQDSGTSHSGFNMTAFAMRLSGYCNGVSKRHGEISRRMWQNLWPDKTEENIPIDHITNGIHVPTWIEPRMELLLNQYLGPNWLTEHDNPLIWELIEEIPDEELWQTHYWLKIKLIDAIREKARQRWSTTLNSPSHVIAGGTLLDPSILTLGFARRFATYKRADLIFHDVDRLKTLLNDRWKPIQIIFAGKAHPADDPGKRLIQKIFNAARDPGFGGRIAFVEDYNELLAQYMVHGVDVWLNNPLPPYEASGTSGMKASLNGVPHFSISDGWWLEGYNGKNGWTFGTKAVGEQRDASDARELYEIIEKKIIPLYYNNGHNDKWVQIMKESIKSNAAHFSARRMVKEYIVKYYRTALKFSREYPKT
jgi:starch phosphorylase